MALPEVHITEREQTLRFWIPSWYEIFMYFAASTLLFAIANAQTIWQFFNNRVLGADVAVSSDYSPLTAPLFNFVNEHDTWIMLLVWALFGCLVFGLVLVIQNIARTVKQEVAESEYMVGGISPNQQYWNNVARIDITFGALAIGWIVYLALYLNGVMPWVSQEFFSGVDAGLSQLYKIFLALAVNTLALYLLVKLTQVLVSAWRTIRPRQ